MLLGNTQREDPERRPGKKIQQEYSDRIAGQTGLSEAAAPVIP
jgi:hypothetical protein